MTLVEQQSAIKNAEEKNQKVVGVQLFGGEAVLVSKNGGETFYSSNGTVRSSCYPHDVVDTYEMLPVFPGESQSRNFRRV